MVCIQFYSVFITKLVNREILGENRTVKHTIKMHFDNYYVHNYTCIISKDIDSQLQSC